MQSTVQVGMYWLLLNHPSQARAPIQVTPGTRLRVLVVDDSATDATLLEYELGRSGFDVSSQRVDSADEMSAALASEEWDVIISDFAMPSFTALDALRIARDDGRHLPVVVVTGYVSEQTRQSVLQAGADDCLNKDDLRHLASRVAQLLVTRAHQGG